MCLPWFAGAFDGRIVCRIAENVTQDFSHNSSEWPVLEPWKYCSKLEQCLAVD